MAPDVLHYRWEVEVVLAKTSENRERYSIPHTTPRVNEKAYFEADDSFESFDYGPWLQFVVISI